MKRLVLIDGHAIIHRAYHALPPMTTPYGQPANAAYGFISILLRVINELSPTHLIVCFDLPVATFRHEAYIAYQAHRPTADQELKDQIAIVKETVEATGIPIYTAAGFEADDVIGTLALQATQNNKHKAENKIDEVIIVTGDRDIMQLVDDKKGIMVYAPIKGISNARLLKEQDVKEYFGVNPDKIIDYKALMGDASDNYPGVPGIGPKTAQGLLEKFGTLEKIYRKLEVGGGPPSQGSGEARKLEGFPDSVTEKLKAGRDSAFLSQHLATIAKHAPIELDLEGAEVKPLRDNQVFVEKLRDLGFKSLIARIGGFEVAPSKKKEEKNKDQMELI